MLLYKRNRSSKLCNQWPLIKQTDPLITRMRNALVLLPCITLTDFASLNFLFYSSYLHCNYLKYKPIPSKRFLCKLIWSVYLVTKSHFVRNMMDMSSTKTHGSHIQCLLSGEWFAVHPSATFNLAYCPREWHEWNGQAS